MIARQGLVVVSGLAGSPFEPRGIRTRAVIDALKAEWNVDLIAGPASIPLRAGLSARAARYARSRFYEAFGLDSFELWSLRRFRRWRPQAQLGLLVAYPFSPVTESAKRLARHGIPYIVDASDPWAITALPPSFPSVARWRRRRAEQELWDSATAAIVTTVRQRDALVSAFPHLEIQVRPNGFAASLEMDIEEPESVPDDNQGNCLRIGHFGSLYSPRIDLQPFFANLVRASRWKEITFHQYGQDTNGALGRLPRQIHVEHHDSVPWSEIIRRCRSLDLALVVGNVNPAQLPSKVVQYLTLPIPRLALLANIEDDSIADYIADKSGWLAVTPTDPSLADKITLHVGHTWTAEELAAPQSESWGAAAKQISRFVNSIAVAGERRGRRR